VLGALNAAAPFTLIALAELELSASMAAVLNAATPLFAALVAATWLGERITPLRAAGLTGGILGVAIVVGLAPVRIDAAYLAAVAASLLAAVAYAVGGHFVKRRFSTEAPATLALGQQLAAAAVLLPFLAAAPPSRAPTVGVALAILALALVCTALAYLLYFRLIIEVGATSGLTVTFLVPVFGVAWAALFLGEQIHAGTLLGGSIVLLSVGAVTRGGRPRRRYRTRGRAGGGGGGGTVGLRGSELRRRCWRSPRSSSPSTTAAAP
jgi:drug/metabolite transporter (DMT)-like permease